MHCLKFERSKIGESVLIVVLTTAGCSSEIENNVSQAHLIIPMVIGCGDSLKVLQPLVSVLLVNSGKYRILGSFCTSDRYWCWRNANRTSWYHQEMGGFF
ncbi:hypothetical protein AVEN_264399-1 [Araneus ventricosus]|uniref:Uncharacterized protein n=1 Tax=Araneus ventricosus TaxID=182803 RepID=A0A4Y2DHV3_ARAVE|nr:hypothetical protein AVEN_264399-1 [Araneus ventricosus]